MLQLKMLQECSNNDLGSWELPSFQEKRETDIYGRSLLMLEREEHLRIDLQEIRWNGVDWIHLAHDRDLWQALVNTAMNLRVP
jgi:hypothetical protein